ncbi:1746_t:CDS:2 [Gigaspora margarita]|uniref:1746_t:CDS:1 n=1 Tax=Gigaspora margarita TaxID=4874 RepID=A0ABN7UNL4_GIGMA|nr:1746_t:CDS:2 [Gigaspora margarita]
MLRIKKEIEVLYVKEKQYQEAKSNNLLEKIVQILQPFKELTTYFSGIKYTTLLVVNTSIEALKLEFADGDRFSLDRIEQILNNYDNNDSNNMFVDKIP